MRAKDYLQEIQGLDAKINNKLLQVEEIRSKLTSISSTSTGDERVQTSTSASSKTEALIIKLEDLTEEINQDIDAYVDEKNKAINLVNSLDNKTYIEILSLRYFQSLSWEEISIRLNYSFRHTTKLHGYALKELQGIVDKKYK